MADQEVAVYDLAKMPTTYDFAAWCVIVKTLGAKHVRFVYEGKIQSKKYPEEFAWRRFSNILLPMCGLAGLGFSVGSRIEGMTAGYSYGDVNRLYQELGRIEPLTTDFDPQERGYLTVTLRKSIRNNYRDSNEEAWAEFAEWVGKKVIVLPDVETSFMNIDLEYRMGLYLHADMNLGSSNGPMALCHFSEAPYLTFNMIPENQEAKKLKEHMMKDGFYNTQFHFAHERQKLVWEPDTLENIKEEYELMFPSKRLILAH